MKHIERKKFMESMTPDVLGKTKEDRNFRYALIVGLFELADAQDSLAACYREMLEIQKAKLPAKVG